MVQWMGPQCTGGDEESEGVEKRIRGSIPSIGSQRGGGVLEQAGGGQNAQGDVRDSGSVIVGGFVRN